MHNAKVHSRSTEPIEVNVAEEGKDVIFSVRDHGVGIPEDKLETIFDGEGLGKIQSSPDGYKGMGIGLSICKTIVLAHGGQIEVKNHEKGAEFIFRLPADIEEIDNESEDIGFSD